jgi:hypothetical protein
MKVSPMTQPLFSSSRIVELKHALKDHPVYAQIDSPQALRLFMEHHIFCVWDFMSLVKSLQLHLTGMILPWRPPKNLELASLIN